MERTLLKSKLHRGTVTGADLHYEGSVTIDRDLMDAVDIIPHEQVDVYDITNGSRITTYAIEGIRGAGEIRINGAAAHLVKPGDLVIIAAYARFREDELEGFTPKVVLLDAHNRPLPSLETA